MELPWNKKKRLQEERDELSEKIQEIEKERDKYREKLKAEEERRSRLSKEKQEAQEKLNRLKDKLNNNQTDNTQEEKKDIKFEKPRIKEVKRILEKLDSVRSPEEDLVSIQSPKQFSNLPDMKGLKNTLNSEDYSRVSSKKSFAAFIDGELFSIVIKSRAFFQPDWKLGEKFEVTALTDFIEKEKHWALVSTGETKIFHEQDGKVAEVDRVTTRVDNQQKKGGFSQGRFERKRDEQVEEHVEKTKEMIEDFENLKLLGNKKLCKELPGDYLGGFDSSKDPGPELFYNFRMKRYN